MARSALCVVLGPRAAILGAEAQVHGASVGCDLVVMWEPGKSPQPTARRAR